MKLCYVGGCGRLGLSLAAWSAGRGHSVVCTDTNYEAVQMVNAGECPIDEPMVGDFISLHHQRELTTTTVTHGAVREADMSFVIVPTPSKSTGAFSLDYVCAACEDIGAGIKQRNGEYHVVVIVSTVMPEDTGVHIKALLEKTSGLKAGEDFGLVYSPEFVRQGSIVHDFANPDQVLIGELDTRSGDVAEEYYRSIVDNEPVFRRMSLVSAEIAKIGLNSALVTKIDTANQLAWLCHSYPGADARDVLQSIGSDKRIGAALLAPGGPVGGPCLGRDSRALVAAAQFAGVPAPVAAAIADYRLTQIQSIANLVPEGDGIIGILGLAYKPGVSLVEESQGLALADVLSTRSVMAYDPMVTTPLSAPELWILVQAARTIVVMTPCAEFKEIEAMNLEGKTVIDIWGMLNEDKLDCAEYIRLGEGK